MGAQKSAPGDGANLLLAEITAIWVELLALDEIDCDADFYTLGGDSLLAMKLISRVSIAIGREIPVRILYEQRTINGLVGYVESSGGKPAMMRTISIP